MGKVGTRAPAAAFQSRWWEPLALADPHRFCSASCRSFISAIIIWTSASATVENVTAASLNDASASHFTGTAESGRRHRSIIAGCFIADFFVRDSCFNISISFLSISFLSINARGQRRVEHSIRDPSTRINISISINFWGGYS